MEDTALTATWKTPLWPSTHFIPGSGTFKEQNNDTTSTQMKPQGGLKHGNNKTAVLYLYPHLDLD